MDVFTELKRLGSLVRQLQGALGGGRIAWGVATFVFSGTTTSTVTITHGLGATPRAIVAMTSAGSAGGIAYNSASEGNTTFDLRAVSPSSLSSTVTAWWIAIG